MTVRYEVDGPVVTVTIDRPQVRNAVDSATAAALVECFERFEADAALNIAVLTGAGGTFCAGFDLKELV
jgi:enoyl-CoA hydratase